MLKLFLKKRVAAVCLCAAASYTVPASGQSPASPRSRDNPIPDQFINLQVLPKDISKQHLVGMMKQFCITFAVRCSFCHSVSDDLTRGSFDSDAKETKQKARELLKLIYAAKLPESTGSAKP